MPNDNKVVNNVDISVGVLSLLWISLLWKTRAFNSHNNPFTGKRMGRHIKLYMLGYALGPYEWVLSYGLGYRLGCRLGRRLGYEWMMEDHKENNKRSNTSSS